LHRLAARIREGGFGPPPCLAFRLCHLRDSPLFMLLCSTRSLMKNIFNNGMEKFFENGKNV
jgi:hypothetical protein